jgi:hypothetical protein
MRRTLIEVTEACNGHGTIDECPILRAVEVSG